MDPLPQHGEATGNARGPGTRLLVVRHGQTVWNSEGRWQGWCDSPLTELGREQAREAARELIGEKIDAAWSSDSERAIETAEIILRDHPGVELQTSPALRERNYGSFEGLSTEEIEAMYPGTRFKEGRDGRWSWRPPGEGGENLHEVAARLRPFIAKIAQQHTGRTVLVVTHSNVVRLLDAMASNEELDHIWYRAPQNACVFVLRAWPDGALQVIHHFYQETS